MIKSPYTYWLFPQFVQTENLKMQNLTGFIVEVRTIGESPINYISDGQRCELSPDEVFVGYCWSEMEPLPDGSFAKVQVIETRLVDNVKRLFEYERKAVFKARDIVMTIRALRGPEQNLRLVPKAITKKYEVWNQAD
jgi:hypothetical protein